MEKLNDIKLVLADLDGTLLHEDKSLDRDIKEVRTALLDKGIEFSFASGRNMHIMQDMVKELAISLPYITNNGANMFVGKDCVYECSILSLELKQTIHILLAKGIPFIAYSNFVVYPHGSHPGLTTFLQRLIGKSEIKELEDMNEVYGQSIFKIVLIHENESLMREIMQEINTTCSATHCVRSEGDVYTVTHQSASKGNAVHRLLEQTGIHPSQVIVFGDNYNDTSMFDVVAHSVVMGNAKKEIQNKAEFVTKSNDEDGVSWFLRNYVL